MNVTKRVPKHRIEVLILLRLRLKKITDNIREPNSGRIISDSEKGTCVQLRDRTSGGTSEKRNCIGKRAEKRTGSLKEGRGERFPAYVCTYTYTCTRVRARIGTSTRYGYWIGLDCRVSSTNTRNLDVGRLLPFLFQTEISRPRVRSAPAPHTSDDIVPRLFSSSQLSSLSRLL